MNVTFKNSGTAPADIFRALGQVYLQDDATEQTQKSLVLNFKEYFQTFKRPQESQTMMPGHQLLITAVGRDVTEKDTEGIKSKVTILFVLSELEFSDQAGLHHMPLCVWGKVAGNSWESLQPIPMWEYCKVFNREF